MTTPATPDDDLTSVPRLNRMLSRAEDDTSDPDVAEVVAAVNAIIPTWIDAPAAGWAAHHRLGATMLAARLYRRRASPAGVIELAGGDGLAYVQRQDPDVALLLGIGPYAPPAVG